MLFSEFIPELADKLAFKIDYDIRPRRLPTETTEILGITLQKLNDITAGEKGFFDIISSLNEKKATELQVELKVLAATFQKDLGLESLTVALNLLFNAEAFIAEQDEVTALEYTALLGSAAFENFLVSNTESYQRLINLSKLVESDLDVKVVQLTYFLKSRYDAEWAYEDSKTLTLGEVDALYDFLLQESNKGQPVVKNNKQQEELSVEEELKKTSSV